MASDTGKNESSGGERRETKTSRLVQRLLKRIEELEQALAERSERVTIGTTEDETPNGRRNGSTKRVREKGSPKALSTRSSFPIRINED